MCAVATSTMTTIRRFNTDDMFKFNSINLDHLTETYNLNFYLQYLAQWPDYFLVNVAPEGRLTAYGLCCLLFRAALLYGIVTSLRVWVRASAAAAVMGKAEGEGKDWHGHVTALTGAHCTRPRVVGKH
jgi:N-terminal acetyltransferase B complex catalytic subunit